MIALSKVMEYMVAKIEVSTQKCREEKGEKIFPVW